MIVINTVNSQRFSLDGVEYFKNFLSRVFGNKIKIYNAYDSNDVAIDVEIYSNIQLNGVVYASATLLQQALLSVIYTRDSLNGLLQTSGYFNRFTNDTGFSIAGNNLTINADWAWEIQGSPYSNSSNILINIPFASVGYHRVDLIIATSANTFVRIAGAEVLLANLPAEPSPVLNTLRFTAINVNDSAYGSIIVSNTDTNASHYKGRYNATTNTPLLSDGTGQNGDYFQVSVAGNINLGSGTINLLQKDWIHYNGIDGIWEKWINNNQSGGGSVVIAKTQLTYTSSTIFTIPQNSQILSVVIGELRHLSAPKYTYSPLLATNNFEITDPTFLADMEAGTAIEITTL